VILPGFGGFIARYVSADIHPITHKISPPSKEIAFNQKLEGNDFLLAHYISIQENIVIDEAYLLVSQFVENLNSQLNNLNITSIDGLGKFYINTEGKVEFISELESNFWEDSFGLGDVMLKPVESNFSNMEKIPPRNNRQPIRKRPPVKNEDSKIKQISKSFQEEPEPRSVAYKSAMVVGILVLLFVGFGSLIYTQKNNPQFASLFSMFKNTNIETSNNAKANSENLEENTLEEPQANVSNETMADMNTVSSSITNAGTATNYHIVIASFQSESNAESLIKKKSSLHDNFNVMASNNGEAKYRVTVASFASKEEAKQNLQSFRAKFGKDAWILNQ
jgi:hypothetical protein